MSNEDLCEGEGLKKKGGRAGHTVTGSDPDVEAGASQHDGGLAAAAQTLYGDTAGWREGGGIKRDTGSRSNRSQERGEGGVTREGKGLEDAQVLGGLLRDGLGMGSGVWLLGPTPGLLLSLGPPRLARGTRHRACHDGGPRMKRLGIEQHVRTVNTS